jgi:hypothetical protein
MIYSRPLSVEGKVIVSTFVSEKMATGKTNTLSKYERKLKNKYMNELHVCVSLYNYLIIISDNGIK